MSTKFGILTPIINREIVIFQSVKIFGFFFPSAKRPVGTTFGRVRECVREIWEIRRSKLDHNKLFKRL